MLLIIDNLFVAPIDDAGLERKKTAQKFNIQLCDKRKSYLVINIETLHTISQYSKITNMVEIKVS